jgi:hypothetical protein
MCVWTEAHAGSYLRNDHFLSTYVGQTGSKKIGPVKPKNRTGEAKIEDARHYSPTTIFRHGPHDLHG